MKANNFIRAVLSAAFGALVYFVVTVSGTSQASDDLKRKVEAQKVVIVDAAPKSTKPQVRSAEKFVEYVVETTAPAAPKVDPQIAIDAAKKAAEERQDRLDKQAKEQAREAKKVADERKERAEKARKAAEARQQEKFAEDKAEKEKRERKERKKKEAAAAKKERESARGAPVPGAVIGAHFGATGPWSRYHTGIDFRASYGTPVRAVAAGQIVYAGNKGNWAGNHVVIKHSDGKKTLYAHLASISRSGGSVEQGAKIGRVGSTGRAFGAHLHLELYPEGAQPGDVYSAVNPGPWMRDRGIRLR